mmetsp:Transcript_17519/g.51239  ORF Transcript_17519/g.51239 Transcript_17519/m.51239 type:complete len:532 (-) Transcript_17519:94-1689(-)
MPGRKQAQGGPGWAKGFKPLTDAEVGTALGAFPLAQRSKALEERVRHLPPAEGWPRPSLAMGCGDQGEAMRQVDQRRLYAEAEPSSLGGKRGRKGAGQQPLWPRIPPPVNDNDWLAMYADEPQTLQDYMDFVTLRSGRFAPSHFGGSSTSPKHRIGLVPIVRVHSSGSAAAWPSHGPDLEALVRLTEVYFDRPVSLLPFATLLVGNADCKKPGGFSGSCTFTHAQTGVQGKFKRIRLSAASLGSTSRRLQVHVDPLLGNMVAIRESMHDSIRGCFCVMGVTMEDLYSANSDLFVAGMAAGGSNVAVFSFHRYHPCLKMDPGQWWDYGYTCRPSDYSYFEDGKKRPAVEPEPPGLASQSASASTIETQRSKAMLRRAGKLLVHELMHLFGIDHCVFRQCIMRGTGHLVEDFAAPFELCPVDLRKMQWRLSFDVVGRYRALRDFYADHGLKDEQLWMERRLSELGDERDGGSDEDGQAVAAASPCTKKARPSALGLGGRTSASIKRGQQTPTAAEVIDLTYSPSPERRTPSSS